MIELATLNLPVTGKKDELVQRLEDFFASHSNQTSSVSVTNGSVDKISTPTSKIMEMAKTPNTVKASNVESKTPVPTSGSFNDKLNSVAKSPVLGSKVVSPIQNKNNSANQEKNISVTPVSASKEVGLSDEGKKRLRMQRFGISLAPIDEKTKKQTREQRFSQGAASPKLATSPVIVSPTVSKPLTAIVSIAGLFLTEEF